MRRFGTKVHLRVLRLATVLLLLLGGTAMASSSGAAVSEGGPPALAVTPAVDLNDHQLVSLTGSGFGRDDLLFIEQCPAAAQSGSCDSNRTDVTGSSQAGTIDQKVGLSAVVAAAGQVVDCRPTPGTCEIRILSASGEQLAAVALSHDAAAPLDAPGSVSLDPNSDLIDGQTVTLSADRQRPLSVILAYACTSDGTACQSYVTSTDVADSAGNLTAFFRVRATFRAETGEVIDCRSTACTVNVAEDPFTDEPISAPLDLDPNGHLAPPPEVAVQPASGLLDGDEINIQGSNWFAEELVLLRQCVHTTPALFECTSSNGKLVATDPDGQFSASLEVIVAGRTFFGSSFDCRLEACDLVAFRAGVGQEEYALVPLLFESSERPPLEPSPPRSPSPRIIEPRFTG